MSEFKEVNIMLDLETMGVNSNAAIISIGAVVFNEESGMLSEEFYRIVDLQSSIENKGVIDASTVIWWLAQSDEARREVCKVGEALARVLYDFNNWVRALSGEGLSKVLIWGNGSDFDNVILQNAYSNSQIQSPLRYNRCYRTLKSLFPNIKIDESLTGIKHNALNDAKAQAEHCIRLLRFAKGVF